MLVMCVLEEPFESTLMSRATRITVDDEIRLFFSFEIKCLIYVL